jgi:membrane-associated protein
MEFLTHSIDVFVHLDKHLNLWAGYFGIWLYVILFLVVFCETGLVITPYLPGDSLLFAVGALSASPVSPIDLPFTIFLLCIAAVLGDATNYSIGRWLGPMVFHKKNSKLFNREYLKKAHYFYEKYGGKVIIFARFMPIVRTFAPFVAGIGTMSYSKFALYNVTGGIIWVSSFLILGYRFANLPVVKNNFHYVILAIIFLSILPGIIEYIKHKIAQKKSALNEEGTK